MKYKNITIGQVVTDIEQIAHSWTQKLPVIDATGYRGNLDLDIEGDFTSIKDMNAKLKKVGLKIEIEKHNIEELVIEDRN